MKKEPQIFTRIDAQNVPVADSILGVLEQEEMNELLLRKHIHTLLLEAEEISGQEGGLFYSIVNFIKSRGYDDTMDAVFKRVAPNMVRHVIEREINEDMAEFTDGAIEGRFERLADWAGQDPGPAEVGHPSDSIDYKMGYEWGWDNANTWEGNELPADARKSAVESQIAEFEDEISEQVVIAALEAANEKVNPIKLLKKASAAIHTAVQEEGWAGGLKKGLPIAMGIIVGEALDNIIIPMAFYSVTGLVIPPLPIGVGEIINPVVISIVGADIDSEELADELGWYEEKFGSATSLGSAPTHEGFLREYIRGLLIEQNVLAAGMCFPFAHQKAEEWFRDHFTKGGPGRAPKRHPDLNDKNKFKVVHGTVSDRWKKPPKPVVHGWVEMGDLVFDDQTKFTKPMGVDKEFYYDTYQPEIYKEFTAEEALDSCLQYGGEGPWDEELYAMMQERDAWKS